MRKSHTTLLWLVLLPFGASGAAASATPPAQLGRCAACHGEDGHARIPGAPNLAGQNAPYLLQALQQYRTGQRRVPVMQAAAAPLTPADMLALARWYAARPPCPPAAVAARP